MPAAPPTARLAALAVALALASTTAGRQPDPPKLGPKLPDGTFTLPPAAGGGVVLSPDDYAKLQAQIDQLKKQLAARKPGPPSGCAVRGKVEKRGDTLVAALSLKVTFRTTAPNSAVALGGKKGFLVSAKLDDGPAPVLETAEDGLVALVEAAGDHTVTLELECPVAGRANKAEVGFELGLPRAAITTLALDAPPGVGRVSLATRLPDAKTADTRRGVDVKQLAAQPGRDGYPVGPVESLDVTWEPPAAAPPTEAALTADWEVVTVIGAGFVETAAKLRPRGPARVWKVAAPADAVVTPERVAPAVGDATPSDAPTILRPTDAKKAVWTVEFPAGTSPADWGLTAVVRTSRPKSDDPTHAGPYAVGPFALLDAARQTGTLRVAAAAHTRLSVRHGPDVRQDVPPGPATDEAVSFFRFASGAAGPAPPPAPLAEVEARPTTGLVEVRPSYRLTLTEGGWRVRAELKVTPVRRDLETLTIDVPADWRAPAVTPPDLVDGVEPGKDGGPRRTLTVRLAAAHKQPIDLVLTATLSVPPGASSAQVSLLRFPGATERDAAVTATVADGLDVRGAAREWDGDQPAGWGQPLAADPKAAKGPPAITGRTDGGLARVDLNWSPDRVELTAELRAEVTAQATQVVVTETLRLRAPEGFGKAVRLRGPAVPKGLKTSPPLTPAGPGEWTLPVAADAKEATLTATYALPTRDAAAPVDLLWPASATRVESIVRVWNGTADRAVGVDAGPWRELPPEPAPGRDVLPVRTLAGSGSDLPLTLSLAAPADLSGATARADRGLVQVWLGADGTATGRARFVLSRWPADGIDVSLPPLVSGTVVKVAVDGNEAPAGVGPYGLRVPLPEAKAGRTAVLDLQYQFAAGGWRPLAVPELAGAAVEVVRVQVTAPDAVPLLLGGHPEQRWALRGFTFAPYAPAADELDDWLLKGIEPKWNGVALHAAAVRADGPVRAAAVPLVALITACSAVVLVLGLLAVRLPGSAAGPVVTVVAGAVAVAAALAPQPAGAAAAAALPGLAVLVLVLAARALTRRAARRRVTHLPGFARGPVADDATPRPTPSVKPRPVPTGSTGDLGAAASG
ncbi:hypothetical protein [Urbifossiella limnaea]|uniref:Uncharacterized protein n=1 Tax=Urbifossiella limnaea TaxID=2528023 RepID=A0A517XYE0_9BACT|nr:hypothetical protein [Urbifossiella limnaea]QDU22550.1 hypothetical protein ETAA1_45330 [Urbifossiella limnaea]